MVYQESLSFRQLVSEQISDGSYVVCFDVIDVCISLYSKYAFALDDLSPEKLFAPPFQ